MRRSAIEPMWPLPASDWFRCQQCKTVVPDTRMSDAEAERRRLNGRDMVCDDCLPAPAHASRAAATEAGDDAPTHPAGAGFCWEGE